MEARYLRVKNWRTHQHYKDRRPPWIKLERDLINGDDGRKFREELTESEQWQLVRIWLYASGSERVMLDESGREVPLVAYEEQTIRIGIRSLKRVALDKFVRLGFLEPVSAAEADASLLASAAASESASTDASAGASTDLPESSVVIGPPRARARAAEVSEVSESKTLAPPAAARKPRERDQVWETLLEVCGIDQGSLTRTGRGAANRALAEIREAGCSDPVEVRGRAAEFRKKWPQISLTPSALAKHWGSLRSAEVVKADKYSHLMEVPAA